MYCLEYRLFLHVKMVQAFWGGYENMTDLHFQDGWRDEIIPEFNPKTQKLSDPFYNEVTDKVNYNVIDLVIDIEDLRAQRLAEFDQFSSGFTSDVTEMFAEEILMNDLPAGVINLLQTLKQRKIEVIVEINGFADTNNIERLINYQFETEEVAQFRAALAALKE